MENLVIVDVLKFPILPPGNALSLGATSIRPIKNPTPSTSSKTTENYSIHVISINRSKQKNAVNGPTARALAKAFRQFEKDTTARVAILRGMNGTFCAGADLSSIGTKDSNELNDEMDKDGPMGVTRMILSKPVIACVEGYAVAGGLELACWADLRVCSQDAVFGVFCRSKGVPLIDGGTWRLDRIVGRGMAMELILTGRPVLAKEALDIHLTNRLVPHVSSNGNTMETNPTLKAAVELAQIISSHPQDCMRNDRISLLSCEGLDESSAMAKEFSITKQSLTSPDLKNAIGAFFGKL